MATFKYGATSAAQERERQGFVSAGYDPNQGFGGGKAVAWAAGQNAAPAPQQIVPTPKPLPVAPQSFQYGANSAAQEAERAKVFKDDAAQGGNLKTLYDSGQFKFGNGALQVYDATRKSTLNNMQPYKAPTVQPVGLLGVNSVPTADSEVNRIVTAGSPLLEAARTRGQSFAQQRGLLNSSLAGQAGEQAVIETATPLAQTNVNSALSQANQANQINAAAQQQAQQLGVGAGVDYAKINQQGQQFAQGLLDNQANRESNINLQGMQSAAQEKANLSSSLQAINGQYETNISNLNNNRDIPAEARKEQQLVFAQSRDNQIAALEAVYNVPLGEYFAQAAAPVPPKAPATTLASQAALLASLASLARQPVTLASQAEISTLVNSLQGQKLSDTMKGQLIAILAR